MRILATLGPFLDDILSGSIGSGSELMRRIYDAGFDGVEIHLSVLDHPHGRRLLEGLEYRNVTFHSNHHEFSLGSANRYRRRAAVQQLKDELTLAADRGVPVLTFHPGFEGKKLTRSQSHTNLCESLSELLRSYSSLLDSGKTILALENMDDTASKLCRRQEEIEAVLGAFPPLGMTCDLAHCALGGLDIEQFIAQLSSRICHVHVSGYQPGVSHGKVSLPRSELDLEPFIRRIARSDLTFVIENKTLAIAEESRGLLQAVRSALDS